MKLSFIVRALTHRNFRLFFAGQSISLIGSWMTRVATSWMVFRLAEPGRAALLLGVVGFCGQIPTFALTPFAGVLVDRWNRHRLLVVTQVLAMIQSFLLALVVFLHQSPEATIAQLIALSVFQGIINAFDMPGRQTFLIEMVTDKEDLPNAIALNSSLFNAARLIGPAIAGMLIALVGEVWCFFLDGVSYIAVIGSLLAMKVVKHKPSANSKRLLADLREGIRYAYGFPPIKWLLLQAALVSFMGVAHQVLIPIFADQIQKGSPYVLGFLMTASGCGALVGALYLASRETVLGLGRVIVWATIMMGIGLVFFAWSKALWLSLVLMFFIGLGMIVQTAAVNILLQTIVDEEKRGRVMSLFTMAVIGMAPFGSLFAGFLAKYWGSPVTVMIAGVLCLCSAFLFGWKLPQIRVFIRPIYRRLGILPAIADGIEAATVATEEAKQ